MSLRRRRRQVIVAPRSIAFVVEGALTRADLPALGERVCRLMRETGASVAVCDVSAAKCDAVTVDVLARFQLAARRSGCQVRLHGACPDLLALVELMGLDDVLPSAGEPL